MDQCNLRSRLWNANYAEYQISADLYPLIFLTARSINQSNQRSLKKDRCIMKWFFTIVFGFILLPDLTVAQQPDILSFPFDKRYGQVEVGGPYVGVEFHKSRPVPSRISFYYPVANSIDLSTDYWKRDESRPMALGIKIGNSPKKWIGRESWRYTLSPHAVTYSNEDSILSYHLKYEFCLTEPAMAVTFSLKNESKRTQWVTVYSHLLLALRTCQTYARKDSAQMTYQSGNQAIIARFDDADTRTAAVFVMNVGKKATSVWYDANDLSATDEGESDWLGAALVSGNPVPSESKRTRAVAAYEYTEQLEAGETMTVVQVIGSSTPDNVEKNISALSKNWKSEIESYDAGVRGRASKETSFFTGDDRLDQSLQWAKGILSANAHYLDGQIVPMPCPAEYNFFFTHDLLMTNLGAVNFDLERVKKNLLYVASLAKDSIIPHAYYWRDDGFKTEFCTPSNWNHLWFIEVSASYLRHSLDTATMRRLYPLVVKSLSEVLTQLRSDHLMHAFRPDWWDLGWKEGSRTYITTLSIRAIEDYLFIASLIDRENKTLIDLEKSSKAMRSALVARLWDDSLKYLINYNGEEKDAHRYMGSLLAPAYHVLDLEKSQKLIESAKKMLLAPNLGIRAVMPADFHKDSVIRYFKIAGNEAGDAYTYINGGVWPHNNAWYALALQSIDKPDEALAFVRQTMTIEGIAESPNGIPAMYEYRYSNPLSPRYGEIDKPSFLWAGGFYLYTMYALAGMSDNVWNLSVSGNHAAFDSTIHFSYTFDTIKNVQIAGKGERLRSLTADGKRIPSLVLPLDQRSCHTLLVNFGDNAEPYVSGAEAIVHSVRYTPAKRSLECIVSSFQGHATTVNVLSRNKPRQILLNGKPCKSFTIARNPGGSICTAIAFGAGKTSDILTVKW